MDWPTKTAPGPERASREVGTDDARDRGYLALELKQRRGVTLLATLKGGNWPSVRAPPPEMNEPSTNTRGTDRIAHEVGDLALCPNMSLLSCTYGSCGSGVTGPVLMRKLWSESGSRSESA